MTSPDIEAEARCIRSVSDFSGFHFRKCGNPAKWLVNGKPLCGIHRRQAKRIADATKNDSYEEKEI